ncbi:MAG: 2-oxoglutarate dehydrogenase E1 component, partial [Rhodoferax sp.]
QKRWWQQKLEAIRSKPNFTAEKKKHILDRLTAAEGLERYLHTKYVGQKRFSLEGAESFIAAMDELIQMAGAKGVQEIAIGMAHRGRLNVLVNTLGKMPGDLFAEFDHTAPEALPAGDVKYHQGFSSDVSTRGGPVHLSLAFNPSHLEIVKPVVEGSVRARMDRRGDPQGKQVLPVLVHGDAAFGGQGVNQETLALAQTRGYTTGGTVHIIINNQIGFTTSDPRDMRSSAFCTDIVKMVEAPVLHVNGDDPEAVVLATQLALEFRMEFFQDVVVDITCFRKLGHNEQDTPSLTQPLMYKKIAAHPGTRRLYADKLATQGLGEHLGDEMVKAYRAAMDAGRHTVDPVLTNFKSKYAVDWSPFLGKKWTDAAETGIPLTEWKRLSERLTTIPPNVNPHQLVKKVYDDRAAMGRGEINVDWGMGEHMAFASLVASGYPVRLSGEDCGRGTFTHRHAVIHDQAREKWDAGIYVPLQNVLENQAPFVVIDSILSEEAVLGFEYGYASNDPNTLVIWEAQFGDFANGAQVVIDQFIASGEVKWGRVNGITLMLPHGYEGQGPEHSSARIERFLQLAADNILQ